MGGRSQYSESIVHVNEMGRTGNATKTNVDVQVHMDVYDIYDHLNELGRIESSRRSIPS